MNFFSQKRQQQKQKPRSKYNEVGCFHSLRNKLFYCIWVNDKEPSDKVENVRGRDIPSTAPSLVESPCRLHKSNSTPLSNFDGSTKKSHTKTFPTSSEESINASKSSSATSFPRPDLPYDEYSVVFSILEQIELYNKDAYEKLTLEDFQRYYVKLLRQASRCPKTKENVLYQQVLGSLDADAEIISSQISRSSSIQSTTQKTSCNCFSLSNIYAFIKRKLNIRSSKASSSSSGNHIKNHEQSVLSPKSEKEESKVDDILGSSSQSFRNSFEIMSSGNDFEDNNSGDVQFQRDPWPDNLNYAERLADMHARDSGYNEMF